MKSKLYLALIVFLPLIVSAQRPVLQSAVGYQYIQQVPLFYEITADENGNTYSVGMMNAPVVDADPGPDSLLLYNNGAFDGVISSLDSMGNLRWAFNLGGLNDDVVLRVDYNPAGYIVVMGTEGSGSFDPDPGPNTPFMPGSSSSGTFVAMYDTNGNYLYAFYTPMLMYYMNMSDWPDITVDAQNNIIITGRGYTGDYDPGPATVTMSAPVGYGIAVCRFNQAMQYINGFMISGPSGTGYITRAVTTDDSCNIYIGGYLSGNGTNSLDFDPDTGSYVVTSNGYEDAVFAKYDSNGVFKWGNIVSGNSSQAIISIMEMHCTHDGYVQLNGSSSGANFNGGGFNYVGPGSFIAKYRQTDGSCYAAAGYGSTTVTLEDVVIDSDNGVICFGEYRDSADVDMGAGVYRLVGRPAPFYNAFVAAYTPAYNLKWARSIVTGTALGSSQAYCMTSTVNNNIILAGRFSGTIDADPSAADYILTEANQGFFNIRWYIDEAATSTYVYPGDADSSKTVDNNDLLPLGVHYGETGYSRDTILNTWAPHSSTPWLSPLMVSGINRNHADCNGDGTVNDDDTLAVNINYGNTRQRPILLTGGSSPVYFTTGASNYFSGDTVVINIWGGTQQNPLNDILGIAFSFPLDLSYIQPGTFNYDFNNGIFGSLSTALSIGRLSSSGSSQLSVVKKDHSGVSTYGLIGTVSFVVSNGTPTTYNQPLSFSALYSIDPFGNAIPLATQDDTLHITTVVGLNQPEVLHPSVFPDPAGNELNIVADNHVYETLMIYDIQGRLIKRINPGATAVLKIDLEGIVPGIYSGVLQSSTTTARIKFVKQ